MDGLSPHSSSEGQYTFISTGAALHDATSTNTIFHTRSVSFTGRPHPPPTIPLAPSGKSPLEARPSRARKEGRIAIVTDVGRGMRWTLLRSARRARPSVRRNRVVLIPRRWDYASDDACASRRPRWLTSPDTGENTYKPLAHRTGNAGCCGVPVVTCLRAFLLLHARLRVRSRTGIPCALTSRGTTRCITRARQSCRGNVGARSLVIPERAKRESGIHRAASWLRNGFRLCAFRAK
jgi:hypothetical protein